MVQDARRLIYSSDYKIPAIVYKSSGSVTNPTGDPFNGCKKFAHNLPFTPLLFGVWSLTSDFQNTHTLPSGLGTDDGSFVVWADNTYIYIRAGNYQSAATFYYRLFAYAPPDYTGDALPLSDTSNFMFDTDKNYIQLFSFGKVVPTSSVVEITHGLGYTPLYKIWKTSDWGYWDNGMVTIRGLGGTEAGYYSQDVGKEYRDLADDNKLVINWYERQPDNNDFAYYQIYTSEG